MNENEEITLSSNLERIKDAMNDIRESTNTTGQVIENVVQAVQNISEKNGLYTVSSIENMFAIQNPSEGDICIINNYQFTRYDPNIRTRMFYFPKSFTYNGEIEEFTDVRFDIFKPNGEIVNGGGTISLTRSGSSSSSGSDSSGSGSGSSTTMLAFHMCYQTDEDNPKFFYEVTYSLDENENIWNCNKYINNSSGVKFIDDFVLFPVDCIITRENNQTLPSIIYEAIKLNKQEDFLTNNNNNIIRCDSTNSLFLKKNILLKNRPSGSEHCDFMAIMHDSFDVLGYSIYVNGDGTFSDVCYFRNVDNKRALNLIYTKVNDLNYQLNSVSIRPVESNEEIIYNNIQNDLYIHLPFANFKIYKINSTPFFSTFFKNADTKLYHVYKYTHLNNNDTWVEI